MASDTQQICSRHSESTVRFDAEEHDACETLGGSEPAWGLDVGEWERDCSGECTLKYTVIMHLSPDCS